MFSLSSRPGAVDDRLRSPHIPAWNWYGTTEANSNESNPSEALNVRFAQPCPPGPSETFASVPFFAKKESSWAGVSPEGIRMFGVFERVNVWLRTPVFTRWRATEVPAGMVMNAGVNDGWSVKFTVTFLTSARGWA